MNTAAPCLPQALLFSIQYPASARGTISRGFTAFGEIITGKIECLLYGHKPRPSPRQRQMEHLSLLRRRQFHPQKFR
jgi:hypothetical protein